MLAHTHTHTHPQFECKLDKQQGITPLCIKKWKKWTPKKWLTEQLKGVIRQNLNRWELKKYFVNTSPPKWPLDWLQQLIHFGTLTWGVWGANQAANNSLWYIHYITLHYILLCGNLAVHFQLGMTPCYCVRMGYFAYIRCTGYNKQKTYKVDSNLVPTYLPSELKQENYFYHDDIIMTSSKNFGIYLPWWCCPHSSK